MDNKQALGYAGVSPLQGSLPTALLIYLVLVVKECASKKGTLLLLEFVYLCCAVRQNAQIAVLLATFGFGHIPQVCSLQPLS